MFPPNSQASRFSHWGWVKRGGVFAALGAAAALGHAPTDLWWLTIACLAVALFLLPARNTRQAIWHGWALGVGYFAVSLRWIISPFMVHVERDGWMAPFALILMAGGFALFWAFASYLAHRAFQRHWLAFPLLLCGVEVLRSLILTGFPWALIGHVLVPTPLAQLAAYGGPHLLSLVVLVSVALLARRQVLWVLPIVIAWGVGWIALLPPAPEPDAEAPVVRLIQPNAPQDQKWDPIMSGVFFDRMLGFTGEGEAPDLVVWPESAIATLLNYAEPWLTEMADAARGAPIIVGVNREEAGRYYNSFVHVGRGGVINGFYDKQHIVPFGEYVPGGDLLHKAGIQGFGSSYGGGFTAGEGRQTLTLPGIGAIRPLICYEGIFAEEITPDARPRALILITNDAWFGKAAGPFQHLAQARLRAIEQGLPMVRVANTGVSAMIDPYGQITADIALNTAGFTDATLPHARPPTLYSRFGDWPVIVLLMIMMSGLAVSHRSKVA